MRKPPIKNRNSKIKNTLGVILVVLARLDLNDLLHIKGKKAAARKQHTLDESRRLLQHALHNS